MDIAGISDLDDRDFRNLITDNIHPGDENEALWELLTSPDLAERTHTLLRLLRKETEAALGKKRRALDEFKTECFLKGPLGKQNYFAAKREHEEWKRRANSFRFMVEARQVQVASSLKASNEDRARVERGVRVALARLTAAVQQHQAATAVSGRRTEQADHDLWRALDELRLPFTEGGDASLRRMLLTFWAPTDGDGGSETRRHERLMREAPGGRAPLYAGSPKARHLGSSKPLT